VEQLEDRRLLVTRVWLDFGNGYTAPTSGPYAGLGTLLGLTFDGIHDAMVRPAQAGNVVYEEELGLMLNNATTGTPFNFVGLSSYLNSYLDTVAVPTDTLTLEEAITAQIEQALEPFDIQVISSFNSNIVNFGVNGQTIPASGSTNLSNIAALDALNDTGQQFGSNDVFIDFAGIFQTVNSTAFASNVPISADFAVQSPNAAGARPSRLDTGGIIDVNYWVNRVLGPGGTGGSLNVALANAALYAIGWDFGLSEVENGTTGPFSNFGDPNVQLLNQSNAMVEGGFLESSEFVPTISDTNSAYFNNFPMMQDGANFQPMLQPGTLEQAALLGVPQFPLPPQDTSFNLSGDGVTISETEPAGYSPFVFPDATFNDDPTVTINSYLQLTSDSDIGPNPDIAYVTGTGGFDQIYITKLNATQAKVTVTAYTDNTYTTTISDAAAALGDPGVISSYTYNINLTKIVTPGRKDDGQPFKIVVDGTTNADQIYLDPTLGVEVEVHGGADVKTLNITGNGAYNVQYTPLAPASNNYQGEIAEIAALIPQGLIPGAAGTLLISGTAVTTSTTVVNKKIVTRSTSTPFKTTVLLQQFNPAPDPITGDLSALRLENFNQLDYTAPGFLNNEYNVTSLLDGSWQISGQVDSAFFPPSLTGNLQFNNIKQLVIDTSKGASTDTVSFDTGDQTPQGLQFVNVVMGAQAFGGADELDFNDSLNADGSPNLEDQNYLLSTTQLLPVQPAGSVFTGFTYSGVEVLTLNGTQGTDQFTVTPSTTTSYIINGDPGAVQNTLAVHLAGTQYSESDDGAGNGQWTFGNRKTITFTNIQNIVNQFGQDGVDPADYAANPIADNSSPIYAGSDQSDIIALANSGGGKPLVQVYSAITNQLLYQFYAYAQNFVGGVRVTTADVDGDGVPDIIVAPGAGISAEVKIYSGAIMAANTTGAQKFVNNPDSIAGALLTDLVPDPNYKSGLYVAVGDVNGDGTPDLITSHSKGAPLVSVFLNDGSGMFTNPIPDAAFAPYPKTMTAGVAIAAGDTDGDGIDEIVTAPGVGQSNLIKEYSFFDVAANSTTPIRQFYGFENTFKGGVSLTMADVDGTTIGGNEVDEIILGAGAGGKSRVRVLDGVGTLEREFQAYTTGNINAAVNVLARDIDGSGVAQLYTTPVGSATTHTVQLLDPLAVVNPLATPLVAPLVDTIMESSVDLKSGINLG